MFICPSVKSVQPVYSEFPVEKDLSDGCSSLYVIGGDKRLYKFNVIEGIMQDCFDIYSK